MADLNTIIVAGRLGNDPDMKYLDNGTAVCSFNLANNTYARGEGDNNTRTTWYRVTIFGKRGENANELLSKGGYVIITGEHSIRTYTDKDGNERTANEIRASDFSLPPRQRADSDGGEQPQQSNKRFVGKAAQPTRNQPQPVDDQDLPF